MTTEDTLRLEYSELLPKLREFRAQLTAELAPVLAPYDAEFRSRVKPWVSVLEKLSRLGSSRVVDLRDLVGIRVVVPDGTEIFRVHDEIAKKFLVPEFETWHLQPHQSAIHLNVHSSLGTTDPIAAEIQILTASDEARRAIEHLIYYGQQPAREATPTDRAARLEGVISTFESLLEGPNVHEKLDVHPYLTAHKFLLFPNPDAIFPEVPVGFGTEYRIDFIIQRADGTYVLVEIENPRRPIVIGNGDFSAPLNHALCQVEDWQEWIEANLSTVEKYFPGMRAPEAWVVIGRNQNLTDAGKRRIARRNVNMRGRVMIRTYDDLIREARAFIRATVDLLKE
jgi:ppGpp synthetase/RelA/SpoT-type nucleotidyltranferase